ncbi:hypothetical protein KY346_04370 [Candidatus Woesearchaeota archaeon]|nr:hypothetical protein [Candidatus Woesearchaeota archaeon]
MRKNLVICLFLLLSACVLIARPLDIPYVKQVGPSCVSSQVTMALQYYFPERKYTLEQIDSTIGREKEKWAWFSQALPILVNEGLDVHYYSKTPYNRLTPEFVLEYYGIEDGTLINEVTDWNALYNSIDFLRATNRYTNTKLPWQEVEKAVNNGNVCLMIIDYNVLIKKPGIYSGHGVTITFINQTHVLFHNSNKGPNQKAKKQDFIDAWNAPGTDNDIIIVRGKRR